jgi:hypothetical protein
VVVPPPSPAVPTNTFRDEDVRAFIQEGAPAVNLDDLNFPADLLPIVDAGVAAEPPSEPSPLIDPYSTDFAAKLSSDLLLRLGSLTSDARELKIAQLKAMSAEDVERENNAARNYYFLNDLGLGDAHKETLWGGTVAPPVKRKAAGEGRKRSRKKSRKGIEVEDEGGDEGEDSEEEPEPDPETPTRTGEGNQNRGAKAARATKKGKPTREWAETADTFLGNKEYGPQWTALRALWWKREEDAGFAGTVSKAVKHRSRTSLMT